MTEQMVRPHPAVLRRATPRQPESVDTARVSRPPGLQLRVLRLVQAAEDIFLKKGYHAATMAEVASAAGMSKKTVYQIIESKSELFGVLLAHHQSLIVFPAPEPHWSASDVLFHHLVCLARFLLSPEQISIIRLIMAEYTHSPDLGRMFHEKRVMKGKSKLEDCVIRIMPRGLSRAEAREMAAMLFGMTIGEFHLGVLIGFRTIPSQPVIEKRIRKAVDIFVAGCCATAISRR